MLPIRNPDVIYRTLAEGAVLFSTRDEVYFGLNDVGARVWELLPPAMTTTDDVCAALAKEYPDVDRQVIREDVEELLAALAAHGLVLARSQGSRGGNGTSAHSDSGAADAEPR